MQLKWVDILKGVGILLVVFGHMTPKATFVNDFIFLFHMPLFFFISGFLFKSNPNLGAYAKKKAIQLLIPYFSFLCLLYLIPQLIMLIQHPQDLVETAKEIARSFIKGGRHLKGIESVFWFVTCLYATQQLVNWLMGRFSKPKVMAAMLVCLMLSCVNAYHHGLWLPLNINVALAAAPIFYLGYQYRDVLDRSKYEVCAVLVAISGVTLLAAGHNNTYDMKAAQYGIPVITFLSALALVVVLAQLCKGLERASWISIPCIKLGQASLVIMFMHQLFLIKSKPYFGDDYELLRWLFAVLASYLIYLCIAKFEITRAFLLGNEKDFACVVSCYKQRMQALRS